MRQFRDWRFTKGAVEPPQEYIDYILCAHVYHCTPLELDEQPAILTGLHVEFWSDEQEQKSGKKRVRRGTSQRAVKRDTNLMGRLSDDARRFIQRIMSGESAKDES